MYLVDGNNVMGQRIGWHRDKPLARRDLMDEMANFAQAGKVSVTAVFDGAPDEHFPDGARYRGITVHYARSGSNADERIKEIVEKSRMRRQMRVVTSDRALADYVRRCGAQVIRAGEFRQQMADAPAATGPSRKENPPALNQHELLREMRYFGFAPEDDE